MKKLFFISILIFALGVKAQDLSQQEYEKAVDFVTCICIKETGSLSKRIDCITEQINRDDINNTDSQTIRLFDELQKLKVESPQNTQEFLSAEIFRNSSKYSAIYQFAENRKESTISDIKASIVHYFEANHTLADNQQSDTSTSAQAADEADMSEQPFTEPAVAKKSIFDYSLWDIILGLLVVIILFLLYKIARWTDDIDRNFKTYKKNNSSLSLTNSTNDSVHLAHLEREIKELRNIVKDQRTPVAAAPAKESPTVVELQVPPPPADEVFFMATPSDEKLFDDSGRTDTYKATQSLYKFTVDRTNKNMATFVFQSDRSGIRDSVNYPHTYLEPVCDPQNALNQNAQRITTLRPGVAEKRNDKWVVTTKAQIKYE